MFSNSTVALYCTPLYTQLVRIILDTLKDCKFNLLKCYMIDNTTCN